MKESVLLKCTRRCAWRWLRLLRELRRRKEATATLCAVCHLLMIFCRISINRFQSKAAWKQIRLVQNLFNLKKIMVILMKMYHQIINKHQNSIRNLQKIVKKCMKFTMKLCANAKNSFKGAWGAHNLTCFCKNSMILSSRLRGPISTWAPYNSQARSHNHGLIRGPP